MKRPDTLNVFQVRSVLRQALIDAEACEILGKLIDFRQQVLQADKAEHSEDIFEKMIENAQMLEVSNCREFTSDCLTDEEMFEYKWNPFENFEMDTSNKALA